MKQFKNIKILFSGEGGQGIQKIAEALSLAATKEGFNSTYLSSFGVEQRGAPSVAFVRISKSKIDYPRFEVADICLAMRERAIPAIENFLSPNSEVIFDSSTIDSSAFPRRIIHLYGMPATKYAREKFAPRSYNVIMFGIISKMLGLDQEKNWESILEFLGRKFTNMKIEKINREAYLFGREAILEKSDFSRPIYQSKTTSTITKSSDKSATIVPARCKGCYICIFRCPVKALKAGQDLGIYGNPVPEIDIEKCIACGNCRRFCPDGAISVEKTK